MSAKHTPGPWHIEVDRPSGIGRTSGMYICDRQGWPEGQLARVNVQDGLNERDANARLIAAAPELLEALRLICDRADAVQEISGGTVHHSDLLIATIDARAAIAKATGASS